MTALENWSVQVSVGIAQDLAETIGVKQKL